MPSVPDEEVAYRLVSLYFREVARLGLKRALDLDAIVNAYLYALQRLGHKEKEMKEISKLVAEEERELSTETKEDLFPQPKPVPKGTVVEERTEEERTEF